MNEDARPWTRFRKAPAWLAVLWIAALEWYRSSPIVGSLGVGIVFLGIVIWAYYHRERLVSRGSFWYGITLFLLTIVGVLTFIANLYLQHTVILGTAILVFIFLNQATQRTSAELQGRLASFVMTVAYFSGMYTLLSLGVLVQQPWWEIVGIGTLLYATIALTVWLDLGVPWSKYRAAFPWMIVLGFELAMVAWWLPTATNVSSAVATIVGMLFVHLCRHVWKDTWEPARGRRYVFVGVGLLTLVLLTAKWY